MNKNILIKAIKELNIRKARSEFYFFCKCVIPSIYKPNRKYLEEFCKILQNLYEGKYGDKKGVLISMPPEHAKTLTVQLFIIWCFGHDINNEIVSVSYNVQLATKFSSNIRDLIQIPNTNSIITIQEIFPNIKIKKGDAAKGNWTLEGRHNSYLATGATGGTVTGMRGNILVIDDPIKNSEVAFNETELKNIWDYYVNTLQSRVKQNGIQIIVQTRWSKNDIIGKLLENQSDKWEIINFKAFENGKMLCEDILNYKNYSDKESLMDSAIFQANYNQVCIDIKGKLYDIKTYKELPDKFDKIVCCVDVADEGSDYTCAIVAGIIKEQAFILDILHSQEPHEKTEPQLVNLLINNKVDLCQIESNNGGRPYARNIERLLKEQKVYNIKISWFHQSKNKVARILSNASWINKNIFLPHTWYNWKTFYNEIFNYQRQGKNVHDDAADSLTQLAEMIDSEKVAKFTKIRNKSFY